MIICTKIIFESQKISFSLKTLVLLLFKINFIGVGIMIALGWCFEEMVLVGLGEPILRFDLSCALMMFLV